MPKLVVKLDDEQYSRLCTLAELEERTPQNMLARLVRLEIARLWALSYAEEQIRHPSQASEEPSQDGEEPVTPSSHRRAIFQKAHKAGQT